MNRTNKTTATYKEDVAELFNHELTFKYFVAKGDTHPKEVEVKAKKINADMPNYSAMQHEVITLTKKVGESTIMQCPNGTPKELIDGMEAECLIILGEAK